MADNNQSTDPFSTWNVGSVDSWVANTNSQQTFHPMQLDPHGITQQYLNVNHYHYNINPANLSQERYAGSINKIQIEGMPPGRPKKDEVKPKFTRAPMTYGEYKRMRDAFINGSETVYPGIASYTQYPAVSVPKGNLNNESEETWDEIESPPTRIVYQAPYNSSESQPLPYDHFFRTECEPNDRNSTDRPPRETQSGDYNCSKCSANNFSHRTDCFRCHEPKGDDVQNYHGDSNNDRNSRPPREPRPGEWNCSKCSANNFSHRTECFRCHEPKGDDVQSYQGDSNNDRDSRPPREPRSGEWNCSKCSANNFPHRTECFRCHEPKGDDVQSYQGDRNNDRNSRPPRKPRSGEWNCSKCSANNFPHRTECFRCHEPKGDDVQSYQGDSNNDRNSRPPREPRSGEWNCSKCSANNFPHRTECFRCHEPKGDDVQSYQGDSNSDRNSRPPRKSRPGEWNCSKCSANNFPHRTECFRCHEPKGDDVQSYQSDRNNNRNTNSRPPREPRPGDWNCSKCGANNFSHRTDCFRCHEPKGDDVQSYQSDHNNDRNTNNRPPRERRPGDWDCTKCKANNFQHRTDCFRCHEPKANDFQSGGSPSRSDGFGNNSWAGSNNAGNVSTTAQDEDDWDDDEPKVVSNPKIEQRKLSSDVYRDDKSNGSPTPIPYGCDRSYDSPEPVPKKRKLSDDWDDDDDEEENEPIKLEEAFNTDDNCADRSSVGENNGFGTPDENNFEEKLSVEDVDDESNFEAKQDVDDENNLEEKLSVEHVDDENNFEGEQDVYDESYFESKQDVEDVNDEHNFEAKQDVDDENNFEEKLNVEDVKYENNFEERQDGQDIDDEFKFNIKQNFEEYVDMREEIVETE